MAQEVETNFEKLISTKQLAKKLGVAEITVWRWREQGMPFKRIGPTGRTIRFDMDEVDAWVVSQGQENK